MRPVLKAVVSVKELPELLCVVAEACERERVIGVGGGWDQAC